MSVDEALRATSQVEQMLREGHSFEQVEQFIEAQPISPERKAALRIQAWLNTDLISRDRKDRPDTRQGTAPPLP